MPLDEQVQEQDEVVTLDKADDEIAAAWKEIQARNELPEDDAVSNETKQEEKSTAERARDEKGKFAKVEKQEAETAPVAAAEQPADAAQAAPEAPPETTEQRDLNRAPSSWKPAAKAKWDALDPEVRGEILRREGDFLKGQSGLLPDAQFGKSMRSVVEPYRMLIESEGATPEAAVRDLLRTAAILRVGTPQQKTAAMLQVVKQYGVQLPGAIGQEQQQVEGQQYQPQPQEIRDPRFDAFLQQQEMQRQAEEQRQQQTILQEIETFRNSADAQGKPLYPYYDNVFNEMVAGVGMVRSEHPEWPHQQVLKEAYDRAVWANPETRQLVTQQKLTELEAQRREENLRRANEAKKAASVNVPRRAGTATQPPSPKFGTPEADAQMLETWRAIQSG